MWSVLVCVVLRLQANVALQALAMFEACPEAPATNKSQHATALMNLIETVLRLGGGILPASIYSTTQVLPMQGLGFGFRV